MNGHCPYFLQVFLKYFIMFPYAVVGRINSTRPVIHTIIPDGGGDSLLQCEGRKCGYFCREIIIGSTFTPYCRNRKYEIPDLVTFFKPAAFSQEKCSFRFNGT